MPVVRESDDNYGRASGDVKKIISAERNNPDRAAAMCVEVGTKRLSGRISYRKARGILRHVGESKAKSTLIIYGANFGLLKCIDCNGLKTTLTLFP